MREKKTARASSFLINHQNSPVRVQFYKPMHDFSDRSTLFRQLRPAAYGVLVLDEHPEDKISGAAA